MVLAQLEGTGVSPVLAQMQTEKGPVPVRMWAGPTPVPARMSGRGEPAVGRVESLAQMRMHMSTAPTQVAAGGGTRGGLRAARGFGRDKGGRARARVRPVSALVCVWTGSGRQERGSNKLHFARTHSEQHHRREEEDACKSAKLLRHRRV
jgi:hypothetical protein